jgi:TATA-box binding protein (TBP) (component of TFIID and TFIIIB)
MIFLSGKVPGRSAKKVDRSHSALSSTPKYLQSLGSTKRARDRMKKKIEEAIESSPRLNDHMLACTLSSQTGLPTKDLETAISHLR